MTTILLNGIPGMKKGQLLLHAQEFASRFGIRRNIHSISMGDFVGEEAQRLYGTTLGDVCRADYSYQQTLRRLAQRKVLERLASLPREDHVIIDTPLTLFTEYGNVPDLVFHQAEIQEWHDTRCLDSIISLLDVPERVADRLEDTIYPNDAGDNTAVNSILDWMVYDSLMARSLAPYDHTTYNSVVPSLAIPRDGAEITLLKMLHEAEQGNKPHIDYPIVYLAGPITKLKEEKGDKKSVLEEKKRLRGMLNRFQENMQRYAITIVPMKIADARAEDSTQIANAVYRDKHFFVIGATYTIAYYPSGEENYQSAGTMEEMRHGLRLGKPVVLINPNIKDGVTTDGEVFGIRPRTCFRTRRQFTTTMRGQKKELLRNTMRDGQPRYEPMRDAMRELSLIQPI